MEKKYEIGLKYGDPSTDGHGMYETGYFRSNYNTDQIDKAVRKVDKMLDMDFEDKVCADYADSQLTDDQYELLKKYIPNIEDYIDDEEDKYVHDYTGLYLAYVNIELKDLEVEAIEMPKDTISIGGYGMFAN